MENHGRPYHRPRSVPFFCGDLAPGAGATLISPVSHAGIPSIRSLEVLTMRRRIARSIWNPATACCLSRPGLLFPQSHPDKLGPLPTSVRRQWHAVCRLHAETAHEARIDPQWSSKSAMREIIHM